jgi:hypothetical protein
MRWQQKALNWATVVMAFLQALTAIMNPSASQTQVVQDTVTKAVDFDYPF